MEINKTSIIINNPKGIDLSLDFLEKGKGGPSVLILSGMHGDEFTGLVLINELLSELDTVATKGRLVFLPIANPLAIRSMQRCTPGEDLDLNRSFNFEKETDSLTQEIARSLFAFAKSFDLVIDLHTFEDPTGIVSIFMNYGSDEFKKSSLELIRKFSPDVIWRLDVEEDPSMLGTFGPLLASQGVRNFAVEMPEVSVITDLQKGRVKKGIYRVLHSIGVISESPDTEERGPVPLVNYNKILSDKEGLFFRTVPLLSTVEIGMEIGKLVNLSDLSTSSVRSNKTGVLFVGKDHCFVMPESRLAVVGEVLAEV